MLSHRAALKAFIKCEQRGQSKSEILYLFFNLTRNIPLGPLLQINSHFIQPIHQAF